MKPNHEGNLETAAVSLCRQTCQHVLAQIARTRKVLLAEWSDTLRTQHHALRLALNEAEALAWQTMYPHLVFPELAAEKVDAVAAWNARQQRLWGNNLLGTGEMPSDVSINQQ